MVHVILATHGQLAAAALEMCEMLTGEKENVFTIGFMPGDSIEELTARFQDILESLTGKTLIITDIQGGSPCNVALVMRTIYPDVEVVSGFNIPLLLEMFELRDRCDDLNRLISESISEGRESIQHMMP